MNILKYIRNIVTPYSNEVIRRYVNELEIKESNQNLFWMREDLLTSKLYSCNINGRSILLEDVLFGSYSINYRQNIIVIIGEKHIGKRSFVNKLLEVCEESVSEETGNIIKKSKDEKYRIPVIIQYEWYKTSTKKLDLSQLIVEVIEEQCSLILNKEILIKDVEKLLVSGRFFIYFEGDGWLNEMENELSQILNYGKIREIYDEETKYRNLAILTVNSDAEIKESFLNKNNSVSIELKKLTPKEVKKYLNSYLKDISHFATDENILEIICYPEHLKMLEKLYNEKLIHANNSIFLNDVFDFYEYFIRANIQKKLYLVEYERGKKVNEKYRVDAIYSNLQDYAVDLYINKKKVQKNPSQYFDFSDYNYIGILDDEGNFRFPLCGYYLLAQYLVKELAEKNLKIIPQCLLEEPLEIVLLWMSKLIEDVEVFSFFWKILNKNSSCKLLLLAKIVKSSIYQNEYVDKIYEKAFENLNREFYDYTVLEAFRELDAQGATHLKTRYLNLDDNNSALVNNIKKRCVYYLGISHSGIVSKMIEELMEDSTDQHLKYHIIRSIVENYGEDEKSTQLIRRYFDKLIEYCGSSEDAIIKSDFCVLYKKCKGEEWTSREEQHRLSKALTELLGSGVYWIRAHAAGAIGRANSNTAYDLLINRIEQELTFIYEQKEGFRNSIKVISYSIEAICELTERNRKDPTEIIVRLINLLDMDKLGDRDIEDSYSTIATGIEYMISSDTEKLPFNLGGRFRNHTINFQKVLFNTFQSLLVCWEDKENKIEQIKGKMEILNDIMSANGSMDNYPSSSKIRILQLSDWHFQEKNSDNNLIIKKVKSIKGINILVITGDLKQIFSDYKNSLSILRDLIKSLGLEPKDVFMVPGNHDCDSYERKEEIVEDIRNNLHKDKEYYRKYIDDLYKGFNNYEQFIREFYGEDYVDNGGLHNKLLIWNNCLHILLLNTALLCDENTEKDKIVDIEELSEIEKNDNIPIICITHHKMSQLFLDHKDALGSIFNDLKISTILSGDIHRSNIEYFQTEKGKIPNYICGKFLGNTDDNWSTRNIAIYELDLKNKSGEPNLYKWERAKLVPAYEFSSFDEESNKWMPISFKLI